MEILGWIIAILLALYISAAPIDECSVCTHCRWERIYRKEEQKKLNNAYAHRRGWFVDPDSCGCDKFCKRKKE